jgi:hypothetical protein
VVWLLGILGTIATAYVTATLHDLAKPLQSYVSDLSCEWRKATLAPDEPKFTILVARLYKDDAEGTHTRRVFETFQGERGFRPVLLCDTLRFDFRPGEEIKQAEEATIKRGQDLIVQHKADLVTSARSSSPTIPSASSPSTSMAAATRARSRSSCARAWFPTSSIRRPG